MLGRIVSATKTRCPADLIIYDLFLLMKGVDSYDLSFGRLLIKGFVDKRLTIQSLYISNLISNILENN